MKNCPHENIFMDSNSGFIKQVVEELNCSYQDEQGVNYTEGVNLPSRQEIKHILNELEEIMFPGFIERKILDINNFNYFTGSNISKIYIDLRDQIARAYRYQCTCLQCEICNLKSFANNAIKKLIKQLPEIRRKMKLDVLAAYDGDPAAKNIDEIILSYPGIYAITIHRIAHELYLLNVPLIPRMMSEYAHSKVGIDIHPGAKIGESFFIDHGTGVVIGETAVIGNNVKIYQNVTLGAFSFPKDKDGNLIRDKKRHPTLEDDVNVYSGATVLGDITLGKGSSIGGNVWLTENTAPHTVVTISKPNLTIKSRK